jgi:SpoVK/Ycf46/Vps4 family AAA+-type ATPase
VFVIASANNISNLPPELTRRGRFDAIFYVLFPTLKERNEVIKIHLRKRAIKNIKDSEINKIAKVAEGYTPAEIESAIEDGLVDSFSASHDISYRYIIEALKAIIPISKTYKTELDAMVTWCKSNAIPASKEEKVVNNLKGRKLSRVTYGTNSIN